MNKETENKKYFVKDESLHTVDNDMFNYADMAKVLNDIIGNNEPPYNVAIIGKWGLGKSSLINLVINRYKKSSEEFLVQEINAWKYEKESLRKVFLKQLWQGIINKKVRTFDIIKKEYANIVNNDVETVPENEKTCKFWKFILTICLIGIGTVLAFSIYKIIQANVLNLDIWNCSFWAKAILSYCKNIGSILIVPALVALIKILLDNYNKPTKKVELNFPIETTDDYEIFLETKIKDRLAKHPNLKIITVIDDLDRLSIDKIVEALDALKAFVGFERCIFLVPFDDEIIKQALNKRRAKQFNDKDDVVESELILDKLFQFKIYLPPILDFDIKKYALELAQQEIPDFINEFCNVALMKKSIRILMHEGVSTPRQVKKLLNSFINNIMVAFARERSGKVQKELLTDEEGIMQIAIISVLQADFNEFYDTLFKDVKSAEKILSIHRNEIHCDDVPEYLKKYFIFDDEHTNGKQAPILKKEHESLLNFLTKTEKYKVPSLLPYLYLAQDDISIKTGDELQRRLSNALKSGNATTAKELLAENKDLHEAILYNLEASQEDIAEIASVSISVFNDILDERTSIANAIVERVIELSETEMQCLYSLSPKSVFDVILNCENKAFASEFMVKYITLFTDETLFKKEQFMSILELLISNYETLNYDVKKAVKNLVSFSINFESVSADMLFTFVNYSAPFFDEIWGIPWFKKICICLDDENDFSEEYMQHLINSFDAVKNLEDVNTLVAELVNLVKYPALLEAIGNILNISINGAIVKEILSQDTATAIAETIIEDEISEETHIVFSIMNALPFIVTEDSADKFDKFLLQNIEREESVGILGYICQKTPNYIPDTIDEIVEKAFVAEGYDLAFGTIFKYLTDEKKQHIVSRLSSNSKFVANKDYARELQIYKTIRADPSVIDLLNDTLSNVIIPQFRSYRTSENYFEFYTCIINILKADVSQEVIDLWVKELLSVFASKRRACLEAINQIPMKMSKEQFNEVFDKIVSNVASAEFEIALDVIINNDGLRPREQAALTAYVDFLISNIETSSDPNKIISTLKKSFSNIPKKKTLVENSIKNEQTNVALLVGTVGKFLNKMEDIKNVANDFIDICSIDMVVEIANKILGTLTSHSIEKVFDELIQKVDNNIDLQTLKAITDIAIQRNSTTSSGKLILKCLQVSIGADDNVKTSVELIRKINDNKTTLSLGKTELSNILKESFLVTTSEDLKDAILNLVRTFKIKSLFKKGLTGEALQFYEKRIK